MLHLDQGSSSQSGHLWAFQVLLLSLATSSVLICSRLFIQIHGRHLFKQYVLNVLFQSLGYRIYLIYMFSFIIQPRHHQPKRAALICASQLRPSGVPGVPSASAQHRRIPRPYLVSTWPQCISCTKGAVAITGACWIIKRQSKSPCHRQNPVVQLFESLLNRWIAFCRSNDESQRIWFPIM